jgi:putative heme degradation protein
MDTKPDQDGRFRVNDFFCHEDTWKMVLSRLVKESEVVVMDLRGFTSQNKGCVYEVNELINVAPLERVVFVIDETTDEHFLLDTVRQSWERMKPTSPNRLSTSGQLAVFRSTGSRSGDLPHLLRALSVAANPA